MKIIKKIGALLSAAVVSSAALAQPTEFTFEDLSTALDAAGLGTITFNKQDINNGLDSFAKSLLVAAPQASVQQGLWADAYIGKLFPSLPPHFGAGFTVGATKLDMSGLKDAATSFEKSIKGALGSSNVDFGKIPDSFVLPTISLDARVGGVLFPFDVGFSIMMTNPSLAGVDLSDPESIKDASSKMKFNWAGFDGSIDYITLGVDARYAVWEGNFILPKLSVGAGYAYTRGQFGVGSNKSGTKANIDMSYTTHVLYGEAQLSKSFLLCTVFGGGRALLSKTTTSWAWDVSTSFDTNSPIGTVTIKDGDSGSRTADGKSKAYKDGKFDFSGVQPQLYAGLALNFLVLQTSLDFCVDARSLFDSSNYDSALWSAGLSVHVKI